jgi:chromosome segregation ATPase
MHESKINNLKTPERNQASDNTSEVYLRTKLSDAYNELENLKTVIKEIKTSDKMGIYETNEQMLKNRSSSNIHSNSLNRSHTASSPKGLYNYTDRPTYDVMNQFKDTLKETERYIQRNESLPKASPTRMTERDLLLTSPKSYMSSCNPFYRSAMTDSNIYPSMTDHYAKYSINAAKDEQERARMTNHILNKSNLDLRNQIRLLQVELESYKNNSKFANGHFDNNIIEFIESMKNSLSTCQVNNKEYQDDIERLQKQNIDLTNEMGLYKEQAEFLKKELEAMSIKINELKYELEDAMAINKTLNDEKIFFQIQLNEKDSKLGEYIEKINSLLKLNESQNKNRGENNSLIDSLNGTIEFLRKSHTSYDAEKGFLKQTIEELNNEILKKNYELESLIDKISLGSKDKQFYFSEFEMIRNEYNTNQKYLEELQGNYKRVLSEFEKEKMKVETAELNIQEKEQIIENMKKTINYLTKGLEGYKEQHDKLKNENDNLQIEHAKFIKSIEINELKLKDTNIHFDEILFSKDSLYKRNLEIEAELSDKRTKMSQYEFNFKIEKQRYDEQTELMNKLKEENKALKAVNIDKIYSLDFVKTHEETLTKLNNLTAELSSKNNEINQLKMRHEEQLKLKNEELKKLSVSLKDYQSNTKEKELKAEIINIQNELDKLNRDHKRKIDEVEEEKDDLLRKYAKLNNEFEALHSNYDKLDLEYKQLCRDKRCAGDYEAELNQYRQKIDKLTEEGASKDIELKKAAKNKKLIEDYELEKQDMAKKYGEIFVELETLTEEFKKALKQVKRIEELEYDIDIKNKKIEQLQIAVDNLDTDYKKANISKKKFEELENDNSMLLKKLEKLQNEYSILDEELKKATSENKTIKELENEKLQLQKRFDKQQEDFKTLCEDYKKATANKRKIDEYEFDIQQWTKKCEKLQDDFNKLNDEYKKAIRDRKRAEDYEIELQQWSKKYEKLQDDFNKLSEEYKRISREKKKADEYEIELEKLTKKYEKLQIEFNQLNDDHRQTMKDKKLTEDFEFERKQWNTRYEKLLDECDTINEQYRKANYELKSLRDIEYEKDALQKKYDTLRNENERLNEDYKKSAINKTKIDDLEYEISSLKKQYDKLNIDYKNIQSDSSAKISQSEYNSLLVRYDKLQKDLNNLDNQHISCSREISLKNKLISSLQTQLDELTTQKKRPIVVLQESPKKVYFYDSQKGIFILNKETEKQDYRKTIMPKQQYPDLSQVNCKFIGSEWLLTILDSTKVLSYNIKTTKFDLIKFTDKEYKFQNAYIQEGSLILNDKNGLFIVTGANFDQLFYFNMTDASMSFISTLKDNHMNGGLVVDGYRNSLICLSGSRTNTVERYTDENIIKGYYSFDTRRNVSNQNLGNLTELKHDRANAGYIIMNDCIYAMFGYSNSQKQYVETIERLTLASYTSWEEIKLTNDVPTLQLRSILCIEDSDNNRILVLGGQDGSNWKSNKHILNYNYLQNTLTINNNFSNAKSSYFNRVTGVVPYYSESSFSFAAFDDNNRACFIEPSKGELSTYSYS